MTDPTVSSFEELHKIVYDYDPNITIFRGVLREDYELIPRVGRPELDFRYKKNKPLEDIEKDLLSLFKNRALPFLKRIPQNEWDWLATAQHYGLPTRLLDWTRNPLVAAYFAVEKEIEKESNSAIYTLDYSNTVKDSELRNDDPFKYGIFAKFIPPHINERIIAQNGLFTIRKYPTRSLNGSSLKIDKIIIENNYRRELKRTLFRYGIHEASLFPGLDSLTSHILWMKTNIY